MKKEMKKKNNNKGFSLVELIVVIAIMAVLMVVLAPAMLRYVEKTRIQKDDSAVSEVANAAELALADETVYNAMAGATKIEVEVADSATIVVKLTGAGSGADKSKLETEIQNTVGTSIDLVSKDRSAKTATIVIDYDTTRQAYVLGNTTWN